LDDESVGEVGSRSSALVVDDDLTTASNDPLDGRLGYIGWSDLRSFEAGGQIGVDEPAVDADHLDTPWLEIRRTLLVNDHASTVVLEHRDEGSKARVTLSSPKTLVSNIARPPWGALVLSAVIADPMPALLITMFTSVQLAAPWPRRSRW